jgi:putative membrane-bound dehydrogenase-like protein
MAPPQLLPPARSGGWPFRTGRLPRLLQACFVIALGVLAAVASAAGGGRGGGVEPRREASPPEPEEARRLLRLDAGLRVELVAAEPEVESPVAMAFDEAGKLWVVEMRDYPNGPAPGKPPGGRIRVLEDRDGDGRFETSHVFADHLLFANGLLPWKGGVIVTVAPRIIYLPDRDRDGRADEPEVWFEGFAAQNPQLRVSHPVLSPDGWVVVVNGLRGGSVRRPGQTDDQALRLGGLDFAFDPLDPSRFELVSGMGQYGNTFDEWGRRFVCDNNHHLRHVVFPDRAARRNPFLAIPAVVADTSVLEPGPLSSGGRVYPISKNWTTSSLHVGRFTAACGVHIAKGDLLPPAYRGNAFTCDPTGNLVHRETLEPHGATFRSRPAEAGREFLASPDEWFRPVFLADGPDGALYVVDMCRAVIEHPEFMPAELKHRPDLTWGRDRGRIWRIVPDGPRRPLGHINLSQASTAELVGRLASPNGWTRTTAQRLLLERQDPAAVPLLRQLARTSPAGPGRILAAWLLERAGDLDETTILALLEAREARVREHGVRLAEPKLAGSERLRAAVLALAADGDAQLRYQVALSLGAWDDDRVAEPLANIALAGVDDRWTRLAVLSAVPHRSAALLKVLLNQRLTEQETPGRLELVRDLAAVAGGRQDATELTELLKALTDLSAGEVRWQLAGLNGLAEGLARRGARIGPFVDKLGSAGTDARDFVWALFRRAAKVAGGLGPEEARVEAVRLLAHADWPTAGELLPRLLGPEQSQAVRLAAARALAVHGDRAVAAHLAAAWKTATPSLRRELAEGLLRSPERVQVLLDELEAGRIKPGELDSVRVRQLVDHSPPEVRARAKKLLDIGRPEERQQAWQRYQAALGLKGDALKGRAVFQKHCAACHRVGGIGVDVGPDIGDTRTKTEEALLGDIIFPNQAIDSNFINYVLTTKAGRVLTGVIAAESSTSVTLRRAENESDTVLRQDIDEMASTGLSLMPEGLEKNITVEEMADLLRFLKDWRYLDGLGQDRRGTGKR